MKTLESLNRKFQQIVDWENQYRNFLNEYLDNALSFCEKGVAELKFKYKDWEEAEINGEEFANQFPISITIEDRHEFQHSIFVTKVYKKNGLFYIDGFDSSDNRWIEGWFTDNLNETYGNLAYFINEVLNQKEEEVEEIQEQGQEDFTPVLIGFQLVDEENCYPSEFGCWDVFASREDAEEYKQTMLLINEWHIIEEWSTPHVDATKYIFHRMFNRTFTKGEKVWVNGFYKKYAVVQEDIENADPKERIKLIGVEKGMVFATEADNIYKKKDNKTCNFCGSDLYINHKNSENHKYFCPICKEIYNEE